jgi:hypothetical protein
MSQGLWNALIGGNGGNLDLDHLCRQVAPCWRRSDPNLPFMNLDVAILDLLRQLSRLFDADMKSVSLADITFDAGFHAEHCRCAECLTADEIQIFAKARRAVTKPQRRIALKGRYDESREVTADGLRR